MPVTSQPDDRSERPKCLVFLQRSVDNFCSYERAAQATACPNDFGPVAISVATPRPEVSENIPLPRAGVVTVDFGDRGYQSTARLGPSAAAQSVRGAFPDTPSTAAPAGFMGPHSAQSGQGAPADRADKLAGAGWRPRALARPLRSALPPFVKTRDTGDKMSKHSGKWISYLRVQTGKVNRSIRTWARRAAGSRARLSQWREVAA